MAMRSGTSDLYAGGRRGLGVCVRINASELCAEEEDLGGIVDPNDDRHKRARGSVGGPHAGFSQIQRKKQFSEGEEERRTDGADDDVSPGDVNGGNELEKQGKDEGDDDEGDDEVGSLENGVGQWKDLTEELTDESEAGADD